MAGNIVVGVILSNIQFYRVESKRGSAVESLEYLSTPANGQQSPLQQKIRSCALRRLSV
jgi:hypothetical protein